MNITLKFKSGIDKLQQKVNNFPKIINTSIKKIVKEEVILVQNRIKFQKTNPDGIVWAPWSAATLRRRNKVGVGQGLLFQTGRLYNSIKGHIVGNKAIVTADTPYTEYLNRGTPKMKKRQFLGWGRTRIQQIKQEIIGNIKHDW